MAYVGNLVPISLGQYGLLTDLPPGDIPPGALLEAKNVTFERGLIQKAPGTLIYNTDFQLDGAIVGLFDWWPETHLQRLIAITDSGKVYRDIGDRRFMDATPIKTGLGVLTPNSTFLSGGNETQGQAKKLFIFSNGLNQIQVLEGDGTTVRDIENPAADWTTPNFPKVGVIHQNRLWAFLGQRAYASDTGDHEQHTSNNLTQNIFPGEGGDIIGAFVFKGRLFAFKEGNFVYYLDDSNADSSLWFWRKLASNFGLAAPNAILDALDDMLAGNGSGTITSYVATDALGDVESADIFRNAQMENYVRANLSTSGVKQMHALYYEAKKLTYFTYRSTYSNKNDMLLVLDVNKQNPRISTWIKGSPQCLTIRKDIDGVDKPIYGSADGYVHFMDYEDRLEGATAFEGAFQTSHIDGRQLDPKLANTQKHFDFLWLEYVAEGNHDVQVDVIIDGKFMETVTVRNQAQDNYLGEFVLDTDYLAHRVTQSDPVPLRGTGRRISFRIYNAGSNESFQISSMTVGFRVGPTSSVKF